MFLSSPVTWPFFLFPVSPSDPEKTRMRNCLHSSTASPAKCRNSKCLPQLKLKEKLLFPSKSLSQLLNQVSFFSFCFFFFFFSCFVLEGATICSYSTFPVLDHSLYQKVVAKTVPNAAASSDRIFSDISRKVRMLVEDGASKERIVVVDNMYNLVRSLRAGETDVILAVSSVCLCFVCLFDKLLRLVLRLGFEALSLKRKWTCLKNEARLLRQFLHPRPLRPPLCPVPAM
jgi:hypothetical protein